MRHNVRDSKGRFCKKAAKNLIRDRKGRFRRDDGLDFDPANMRDNSGRIIKTTEWATDVPAVQPRDERGRFCKIKVININVNIPARDEKGRFCKAKPRQGVPMDFVGKHPESTMVHRKARWKIPATDTEGFKGRKRLSEANKLLKKAFKEFIIEKHKQIKKLTDALK